MRFLITGGSGFLGSRVSEKAIKSGYEVYSGYNMHEPNFGAPVKIDICNRSLVRKIFEDVRPEVVVHTAALTDVDRCEEDKELAWRLNVDGTRNVIELSCKSKAFLIYVSTDYVFSGQRGLYNEMDEADPLNYYGITKFEGEKAVKVLVDEWCIARSSVIYGSASTAGKMNFALWVLQKLRNGEPLNIITDQCVSPTLNTNLAEMILEVAERKLNGVYHLAGATPITRYDFARQIAGKFGLNQNLIRQAKSEEIKWKAKRPRNTSLDVSKATRTLRNKPLDIERALDKLKEDFVI